MKVLFLNSTVSKIQNEMVRSFINQFLDNVEGLVIVDFYKGNKLQRILKREYPTIKYEFVGETVQDEYRAARKFIKENDVELAIAILSPFFLNFKYDNYTYGERIVGKVKTGELKSSYSIIKNLENITAFMLAFKDTKLLHVISDSEEIDYNKFASFKDLNRLYILEKPEKDMKYAPLYENQIQERDEVKECDFFFSCSTSTKWRKSKLEKYSDNDSEDTNFQFRHFNKSDKRFMLSQEEYYNMIAKTRFTLVIQSYDIKTFSIIRFIESIKLNCLPLIMDDVCLDDLKRTFPDIYEIASNELIVKGYESIRDKVEELKPHRKYLIQKIKETKSYKTMCDSKKIKSYYKKLIGGV